MTLDEYIQKLEAAQKVLPDMISVVKGIADNIVANTTCITIDASELKRQAKEE